MVWQIICKFQSQIQNNFIIIICQFEILMANLV